ncbi:MAG: S1 RNA-binding domain-containing protein [Parcubacteria group bacterium]|nr:S1 RNA-binding domain-containing protein [Parcubacteria group bacterium]
MEKEELLETIKEATQTFPKIGDIINGTVLESKTRELFLDLGFLGTGIIYGREYIEAGPIMKTFKPGDKITAKLIDLENENGYIELSLKEAGEKIKWDELKKLRETGEVFEGKVLEANRGGLILDISGIKGFLPVSQLSLEHYPRVEGGLKEKIFEELGKFSGQSLLVKIIDLNQKEERVILSEKAGFSEKIKKALSKYSIGDDVEGEVTGIADFGAFIRFDETLEGLIHISELSWQLVENPANVVKVGEKVKAKIISMENNRVALSLKALKPDPWAGIENKYKKEDMIEAQVIRFSPYGAFAQLAPEIYGLIHISEFQNEENMKKTLEIGKNYKFKITGIEPQDHRLTLSLIIKEDK